MELTIAEKLEIKDFPFEIKDNMGRLIYSEDEKTQWTRTTYDKMGNETYIEKNDGFWVKTEYNKSGEPISLERSDGIFMKFKDTKGNTTIIRAEKYNLN